MKKFSRLDIVGIAYKFSHCHRVSSTWTSFFFFWLHNNNNFFFLCAIESRHSAFCMTAKINMLEASQWLDMCRIGLCHCCVWCSLWWHGRHRIGIGLEGNFIIVPRKKREKKWLESLCSRNWIEMSHLQTGLQFNAKSDGKRRKEVINRLIETFQFHAALLVCRNKRSRAWE